MLRLSPRLLLSLCLGVTTLEIAQAAPGSLEDKLLQCRQVQDQSARLGCFEGLADEVARQSAIERESNTIAEVVKPPVTPAASRQAMPAAAPVPVDTEALFGKTAEQVNQELEIAELEQIRSQVIRTEQTPTREYIVYLENGQIWRQKSDRGSWRIKEGEIAVISSAFLGSYKMRAEGQKRSVRATRID